MRLPSFLCAFTAILLTVTSNLQADPPEKIALMPALVNKTADCPKCDVQTVCTASGQKIRVELAAPEVVVQHANCAKPCCGILRCCHFPRCFAPAPPMQSGVAPMYYSQPYAVAPMQYGMQPMQFSVAPMQFGVPPMQFGVAPMQFNMQPMQFSVAPMQFGVQPMPFGVAPTPQGQQPSAQGTSPTNADINDTIKQLNLNLQGLIKVVDRHHDYIVDHESRLKKLTDRVDALEKKTK